MVHIKIEFTSEILNLEMRKNALAYKLVASVYTCSTRNRFAMSASLAQIHTTLLVRHTYTLSLARNLHVARTAQCP